MPAAVAWYVHAERIQTAVTRTDTLVDMTDAWANDQAAGHDAVLLSWRRADVADLNRLARDGWARMGRLHGPDVAVSGGRRYAVGDRIVALAPDHAAGVVTSEQMTVTGVDSDRIVAETSAGRAVTLTGTAIDVEHLDHAYALTVHRAQGATYDRAHVLAAGGGRELAYVALSRARDHTTIHATADGLAQAVDDLHADWGVERHQRWITQTPAEVGRDAEPARSLPPEVAGRVKASLPADRVAVGRLVSALEADYEDLCAGEGRWANTPEGQAARRLLLASGELADAERRTVSSTATRRDRKAAVRSLPNMRLEVVVAEEQWAAIGRPVADELSAAVASASDEMRRHETAELVRRLDAVGSSRSRDIGRGVGLGR